MGLAWLLVTRHLSLVTDFTASRPVPLRLGVQPSHTSQTAARVRCPLISSDLELVEWSQSLNPVKHLGFPIHREPDSIQTILEGNKKLSLS